MHADLALIGHGNVAKRFAALLEERRDRLSADHDLTCAVVATASRRHGCTAGGAPCRDAFEAIAHAASSRADLRVVVETTTLDVQSGEPAISHVRAALERGCDVVTANKGPVAFAYAPLAALARRQGRSFLFEGSVMDGVPVFNLVRETLPGAEIRGFEGVINSTTNHILTAMERGIAFPEALAQMQRQGIAEADPSLDVDGWDAAAKTAALANVLLGAAITPHDVARSGISDATGAQARTALQHGRRVKLVASARRDASGRISAQVASRELTADHLLAQLEGSANALVLETDLLDRIAITQLDGGLTHTAYALLSDLLTIARRNR